MDIGAAAGPRPTQEEESELWQRVYRAREDAFRAHLGPIPEHILKMMPLTGVWPGGGLLEIPDGKLGGACVTASFGTCTPASMSPPTTTSRASACAATSHVPPSRSRASASGVMASSSTG